MKPPRCIAHNLKDNRDNYRLCGICKNYCDLCKAAGCIDGENSINVHEYGIEYKYCHWTGSP